MKNAQLLTPVEALDVPTCFTCGQLAVGIDNDARLRCEVHAVERWSASYGAWQGFRLFGTTKVPPRWGLGSKEGGR